MLHSAIERKRQGISILSLRIIYMVFILKNDSSLEHVLQLYFSHILFFSGSINRSLFAHFFPKFLLAKNLLNQKERVFRRLRK